MLSDSPCSSSPIIWLYSQQIQINICQSYTQNSSPQPRLFLRIQLRIVTLPQHFQLSLTEKTQSDTNPQSIHWIIVIQFTVIQRLRSRLSKWPTSAIYDQREGERADTHLELNPISRAQRFWDAVLDIPHSTCSLPSQSSRRVLINRSQRRLMPDVSPLTKPNE